MPVYECTLFTCPNQYTDGTPRKRLYCKAHRDLEPSETATPIDRLIVRLEAEVKKGNSHGYPQPTVWAYEDALKWAIEERGPV